MGITREEIEARLRGFKLDSDQRRRADDILFFVVDNPDVAAHGIVGLLDEATRLEKLLDESAWVGKRMAEENARLRAVAEAVQKVRKVATVATKPRPDISPNAVEFIGYNIPHTAWLIVEGALTALDRENV